MKKQSEFRNKLIGLATAFVMTAASLTPDAADMGLSRADSADQEVRLGRLAMESSRVSGFAAASV